MDLALTGGWLLVLAVGIGLAVALRGHGVRSTHVRDLLHVGAGVWVLGWPLWQSWVAPTAIVLAAAGATAAVPALAPRSRWAARFAGSVTGGDERYPGLVHYTLAFAVLTPIGLLWAPFPAAAALLALAWGDGPGGAVGRRFGRHRYRIPGGKPKSLEGTLAVAIGAAAGALVAGALFAGPTAGMAMRGVLALGIGVSAALAESVSPRGLDNLIVPAAVFALAAFLTNDWSPS